MKSKNYQYYFPQYWPAWLIVFIFRLLTLLPFRWQLTLGKYIGLLTMRFAKRSKHIAQVNLNICFPEKSEAEKNALLRESFINVGKAIFETTFGFWASNRRVKKLAGNYDLTHIKKAMNEKRGLLVLGAHFTTIEIVGRLCAMEIDYCIMYRPHKIGIINYFIEKALSKHYQMIIPRNNVRKMASALKKGYAVWYSGDVNSKRSQSVFAPFFGTLAATSKAPSKFVKMTGCVVVPIKQYRRKDDSAYDIHTSPALENFPSDDLIKDATRTNQIIEAAIRECPEQYLWQYMRFKTRPEGERKPY